MLSCFLSSLVFGYFLLLSTANAPPCWIVLTSSDSSMPGCHACPSAKNGICPEHEKSKCFTSELECCSKGGLDVQATRLCRTRFQEVVDLIRDAESDGLRAAAVTLPEGEVISMSLRPNRQLAEAVSTLKNPLLDMSANVYYTAQCTVEKTCNCVAGGPCCCCQDPDVRMPTDRPHELLTTGEYSSTTATVIDWFSTIGGTEAELTTGEYSSTTATVIDWFSTTSTMGGTEAELTTGLPPTTSSSSSTTHPCSANYTLDLLYMQENSWSFHDYLPAIKKEVPDLLRNLEGIFGEGNFRAGMASFVDKPIEPLGQYPYDYCYWSHVEIGYINETRTAIEGEVTALQSFSGRDGLEGQLQAMLYASLHEKWDAREMDEEGRKILRIMWMSTESGWHEAGDADFLDPHPGDAKSTYCGTNDYPSRQQVSEALRSQNLYLVILVPHEKVRAAYMELLKEMNVTGGVYMVDDDWEDIVKNFLEAMTDFCQDELKIVKDDIPQRGKSAPYDPSWLIDDDDHPQPKVEGADIKYLPYSHTNQVGPFHEIPSTSSPSSS